MLYVSLKAVKTFIVCCIGYPCLFKHRVRQARPSSSLVR